MKHSAIVFTLMLMVCLAMTAQTQKNHTSRHVQKGAATFYSKKATGARTANGERLHHDSMTCAHRTHPFGTLLKVKYLKTNKEVIVKVTDRGPFRKGLVIDLSWGAAKALGMINAGVGPVEVEVFHPQEGVPYRLGPIEMPEIDFTVVDKNDDEEFVNIIEHPNLFDPDSAANSRKSIKKK